MDDLTDMTAAELAAEHDRICDPADRIGGRPWKKGKARLVERIERLRRDAEPLGGAGSAERKPEAAEDVDGRRETVGALVEAMLTTDAAYDEIVAAVRERFPEARTTRRSVASVASAMRKRGAEVSLRRGHSGGGKPS